MHLVTLTGSSHVECRIPLGSLHSFPVHRREWGRRWGWERSAENKSGVYECCRLQRPESLTFFVPPDPLLTAGQNPEGIIKGSFLREVPHITSRRLWIISARPSSSSTCSNFALKKKKKQSLSLLVFQRSVGVFTSRITETSFSLSEILLLKQ